MILPKLKKIKAEDPAANEAQSYVREQFGLINAEFLRGAYLTTNASGTESQLVTIGTTPTTFQHGLGEPLLGYIIVDQRGPGVIYRVNPVAGEDTSRVIVLQASASVVAKIWCF